MSSLRIPPLPADTARAAEAAFGRDHLYLRIGRQLDNILANFELPAPGANKTYLAEIFWPYSLACILQYWEDLTDHQMVNATRTRLDLKYALHLPLDFPGFEPSMLCVFRQHVLINETAKGALQEMINHLEEFVDDPNRSQADAEQVVGSLCLLSRAEIISETMGNAIEAVAVRSPEWLLSSALPHWYKLYYRKPGPQQIPRDAKEIEKMLMTIGKDGQYLLEAIDKTNTLLWRNLPEIQNLRREWKRQFDNESGKPRLRSLKCLQCATALDLYPPRGGGNFPSARDSASGAI